MISNPVRRSIAAGSLPNYERENNFHAGVFREPWGLSSGNAMRNSVPHPGADWIFNVPSTAAIRWRMMASPRVGFNAAVIGEDQRESVFFKSREETGEVLNTEPIAIDRFAVELRPNESGVTWIVFEVWNRKRFL
jgi:hypothetical protein